jgi:transcriptional regulator with XRE-family HTH domain
MAELPEDSLDIAKRIVEIRKTLGLKQTELSASIKMSQSYIGNIENGKRKVNDRVIRLLAMTYGVNEHWLRTGMGFMFDTPVDPKIERITQNFKRLDGLLQDYVLKQVELVVEYHERKGKS